MLIGKVFHVGCTPEGYGSWCVGTADPACQVPVRQALERDEQAVAVWKAEVCKPLVYGRRKGEAKDFTWTDYSNQSPGWLRIRLLIRRSNASAERTSGVV
jgi:hypothetical protein